MSTYWWERDRIGLVQLLGTAYSGFRGIAYWVWSFNLLPLSNGIEYHFSGAHTKLEFISCTLQNGI